MLQLLFLYVAQGMLHERNMALMLRWEFSILESDVRVICIHIFLMLQVLISDVATIIYQCCDGLSNEKILIGRPGASSAVLK